MVPELVSVLLGAAAGLSMDTEASASIEIMPLGYLGSWGSGWVLAWPRLLLGRATLFLVDET